jgi:hypothetical protein
MVRHAAPYKNEKGGVEPSPANLLMNGFENRRSG